MLLAYCNAPQADAERLARLVVNARLAACVNLIGPVTSVYTWEGKTCVEPEVTMLLKTTVERVNALRELLVAEHPYDLPEFIVCPIDTAASHPAYVQWVHASTESQ